jgi:hypothetical protein
VLQYLEYKRGKDVVDKAVQLQIADNNDKIEDLKAKMKGLSLMEKDKIQDQIDVLNAQNRVYEAYLGRQSQVAETEQKQASTQQTPEATPAEEETDINESDTEGRKGTESTGKKSKKSQKPKKTVRKPSRFQARLNAVRNTLNESDLRGMILMKIASGDVKFSWRGTKTSKGISQEMGLGRTDHGEWKPSNKERLKRISILRTNDSYTPEQLAHELWEEFFSNMDTQDIRNEILDVLRLVHSPSQALTELERRLDDTEDSRRIEELMAQEEELEAEEALINEVQEKFIREDWERLCNFARELQAKAEMLGMKIDVDIDRYNNPAYLVEDLKYASEDVEWEYEFYKAEEEEKKYVDRKRHDAGRDARIGESDNVSTQKRLSSETAERTAEDGNRSGETQGDRETPAADRSGVGPYKKESGSEDNNKTRFQTGQDTDLEAVNSRFNEELDQFKKKRHRGVLHLGTPLEILRATGVKNGEITITQKTLKDHLDKHGLTTEDLKGLAKAIQKPLLVYNWGKNHPSTTIVTEMTLADGRKIAIGIRLENKGNDLSVNEIATIHGKTDSKLLDDFIKATPEELRNEKLKWVEKEKVLD